MRKKKFIMICLLLFWGIMANHAFAGTAKVFIFKSKLSAANLSNPSVFVFSSGTDQSGSGNALVVNQNYTVDPNAKYQGNDEAILVDVDNCPGNNISILLKTGTRYAIIGASAPDIPGPDQTPDVVSYKLGKPTPPIVADNGINAGFETAQVAWTLDPDYQYSAVYFMLSKASTLLNPINDSKNQPQTNVNGKSPYAFGEYVDARKLDTGTTYYIGLWGTVAGVITPSDYSTNADSQKAGINVLTFITKAGGSLSLDPGTITLRNGINFISMPFNRKGTEIQWYAYEEKLGKLVPVNFKPAPNANKIEIPRDIVDAINEVCKQYAGGAKVISTFGRWVEDGQPGQTSDKGVLFQNKDPNVLVKGAWANIGELKAENGYQVYISGLTQNATLKIFDKLQGGQ